MALALNDRVQQQGTANTTVSFTLTAPVAGFQSFAVIGNGNTTYYSATDAVGNWEVGIGTYSTTGPTLTRTTILSSSNSNTAVTFSGVVNVFVTYPSDKSVNLDGSNNVSPLGTISSGTWNGSTIGVAYGGTGVTTSSGPNSVVLRDSNSNITVNRLNQGTNNVTAAGGTTILTAASAYNQYLTGTGGQTFRLPDATTLTDTTAFVFNNNATGTLTIQDNASATVGTVTAGGSAGIVLLSNATVAGTWDVHGYIPENVTWGTNALALGSTVITGGTWQGGTIGTAYGGTGLTSFSAANNALYSTGASTLTAGTLPVEAGGSGATTLTGYVFGNGTSAFTASSTIPFSSITGTVPTTQGGTGLVSYTTGDIIYASATNTLAKLGIGSTGQVLSVSGGIPTWTTPTSGGVSSFQTSLSGLTPSTATTGAVTLAGTLGVTSGGTGTATSFTPGSVVFAGTSGVYSQDNANLFWNDTNNRLGIGTTSPAGKLDVVGTGTSADNWIFLRSGDTVGTTFPGLLAGLAIGTNFSGNNDTNLVWGQGTGSSQYFSISKSTGSTVTEQIRITSGGNVSIGTGNNPSAVRLVVNGSTPVSSQVNVAATFGSQAASDLLLGSVNGDTPFVASQGAYPLAFYTNATERMRITSGGSVGIGTSVPGTVRALTLDNPSNNYGILFRVGGTNIAQLIQDSTGFLFIDSNMNSSSGGTTFRTGGTERMRIDATGNVTVAQAARGTVLTDNDLSFNMNASSNFSCTPAALGTLTFTNITSGQSGFILLINTGGFAISAAATTKVSSTTLTTISTAGTYLLSYFSDGTNVFVTNSGALA